MNIQENKNELVLRRYAGTSGGKSFDTRIGTVPLDTSPSSIPADVLDDLTPRELRQLQARLTEIQKQSLQSKASDLVSEMNDIASALESGLLDSGSIGDLHKAASVLAKRSRSVKPKGSSSNPDVEQS